MKKYAYNDITVMQYIFIISAAQVGTGILSLPRVLAEKAGTDSWIALFIGWFCAMTVSIFLIQTAKHYPNDTLYEILIRLFGKIIGTMVVILYMIYFAFYAWTVLINGMLYIKGWLLPKTPDYIILFLFSIPTFLVARNGVRIIGRYCELCFYMTMWIPLFFFIPLKNSSWLHFLPLIKEGWKPIFSAVPSTIFSFIGFEIAFFLYPFLKKKQYATQGIIIANTITFVFYLFTIVVCFLYFSPDAILEFNQPVLNLLKVIEFRFLERFDMILLAIYLIVVSTAWIPCVYGAAFCSSQLMGKQDHTLHVAIFLLAAIIVTFWIHPSWNESELFQKVTSKAGLVLAFLFPVFLWIYNLIHKKYFRREAH